MTDKTRPTCGVCGEPMPAGEEMFKYHGYSGPCPKPRIEKPVRLSYDPACHALTEHFMPTGLSPRRRAEFAQAIQDAVETWIESTRDEIAADLGVGRVPS